MTTLMNWDWDLIYREGTPVWETGEPSAELVRFLDEKRIGGTPACRETASGWRVASAIDIGCGTGADAIYMVRRGLEVTAVDSSPTAIERARAASPSGRDLAVSPADVDGIPGFFIEPAAEVVLCTADVHVIVR